ncbi:cucumber peeling cupredoxin-like [Macadamia integrifolia]|uniref:cucumber peeling cupredoxin-like n=1 Tax=Macadamia integrifolia TaxID=60698 RepID=UPI001C500130|nr:cucumber peeling cupredoxin-like [Macadamia integrifolia]
MFNFTYGAQDVGGFLKADYESCTVNVMNTINGLIESLGIFITIETAGEHYYTCSYGDHYRMNQKLAIIAYDNPISSPSPPPPPTSSSSVTVPGFSLLLRSIVIAFFY